jgi:hypothetical protein
MKGWWRDKATSRIPARIHRLFQTKWRFKTMARILAKLKVSKIDRFCPVTVIQSFVFLFI